MRPGRHDFDGLVQQGVAQHECPGLQREALISASSLDPVRLFVRPCGPNLSRGRHHHGSRLPAAPGHAQHGRPGKH
jgi:hypothetical protein